MEKVECKVVGENWWCDVKWGMISSGASCYITDKQRGSFQELTKAGGPAIHLSQKKWLSHEIIGL